MATKQRKVQKPVAEGSVSSSVAKVAVKKVTEERNTTKPKRPTVKELQAEIERLTAVVDNANKLVLDQVEVIRELANQSQAYALTIDNYEEEVSMLRRENKELSQELYKETPPSPKGWFAKLLEKMGA